MSEANKNNKFFSIHLGPAKIAVDLGDGSERGEYVNQDVILNKLGRPHRGISLMYCYYPFDKEFPARISEVWKDKEVSFAWDYPYDDYFTYKGGLEGNTQGEPFTYMRDVRRHGQEVILTLTVDPKVSDEQLIKIAEDLRPFGRMMLRINHEATGNWFSFNKRATYQEVADFYVRFHEIIKEHAPNVSTILCIGGIEDLNKEEMEKEKEFAEAVCKTDIWSVDKYMALHWGWPYDVAEVGGNSFKRDKVEDNYLMTKRSYERFKYLNNGVAKPMLMSEFNADGDVTGPYDQAKMVKQFVDLLKADKDEWFSGFTFYQFRDRGRLGLQVEDPNNPENGFDQPVLDTYKEIIFDEMFYPQITKTGEGELPVTLRWGSFEDSTGLEIPVKLEDKPVFFELYFEEELNLMIEVNGKWFYKSPKTKVVDLMPAFFEKPIDGAKDMSLKIFAPPATGENDPSQGEDWAINYYTTINKLPKIRIRYKPIIE